MGLGGKGEGVRLREIDHDLRGLSCDRFVAEGLGEGRCEGGEVGGLLEPEVDKEFWGTSVEGPGIDAEVKLVLGLSIDGPGPAALDAATAPSFFLFSSASFLCCSSCSSKDKRIASMSINLIEIRGRNFTTRT